MVRRTSALCDGKIIGIETIYTVINGDQINIPHKLKALRIKSRENKLFCPCGCGANLILVAGDKNLRQQHFREKSGTGNYECKMPTEGVVSINSRIVLKCWLDDKLKASDIESRVPMDAVEDTDRKPEFTFLSREKRFAIRYWKSRANIMEDKLDVFTENTSGIQVYYIVDVSNGGGDGQYPEALMKIQERQKYCLLLTIDESEYDKATMAAVFYEPNVDGLWQEIYFADANLKDFDINEQNEIFYMGKSIDVLYSEAKDRYAAFMEQERIRRDEEQERRKTYLRTLQEAEERKRQEEQKQKEEAEKRLLEFIEEQKREAEQKKFERLQKEKDFKLNWESGFAQQDTPIRDADGNRWVKCEYCGKLAMDGEFVSYGGKDHINLGVCKECSINNPAVKMRAAETKSEATRYDPDICPECGGELVEKKGPYGRFLGCSNYPNCKHTKKMRK